MRYDVFISYSSIDQKITEGVCAYLEQQGIRCFVAYRDIPRGVVWATAIVEALENSRMMVVLFSKNFNDSSQVEREIELASNMEMPILTFRLSDVAFRGAKKYYLQNLNWIDAFPNPERSFGALHRNVASLLGIPVSGGTVHVKKDPPKSPETNKSNRFLWIVIACLSVALVVALVFNDRALFGDDTDVEQTEILSKESVEEIFKRGEKEYNSKNYSEAFQLFKKAADNGHMPSQNHVGYCYKYGLGVTKDLSKAVNWYKIAAKQGDMHAQNNLGNCYYKGEGVAKDFSNALKWYKKAAEQGHEDSQYMLGICYYNGEGVSKDLSEAFKWFKKSAEQGNAEAQSWMGYCYYNGEGVSKDVSEAVKWFKKSAEQGNAAAQYNLGICYEYGDGVSKDVSEAIKWYKKSADQGYENAKKALERLEKQ